MCRHAGVFDELYIRGKVYQSWEILETKDENLSKSGVRSSTDNKR